MSSKHDDDSENSNGVTHALCLWCKREAKLNRKRLCSECNKIIDGSAPPRIRRQSCVNCQMRSDRQYLCKDCFELSIPANSCVI